MDCLCSANWPLSLQSLRQLLILLSRYSIWSSHLSLSQRIFRIPLCIEENFDRSFSFHRSSSPLDAVIQFRLRDFNSISLPWSDNSSATRLSNKSRPNQSRITDMIRAKQDLLDDFSWQDLNHLLSLSLPQSEFLYVVSTKRHFYTQSVWRPANILQHLLFLSVGEWSFNWSDEICIVDLTLFFFLFLLSLMCFCSKNDSCMEYRVPDDHITRCCRYLAERRCLKEDHRLADVLERFREGIANEYLTFSHFKSTRPTPSKTSYSIGYKV